MEPAGRVLIVGAQIASGPEARLVVNTGAGTSALGRIEGLLGLDFLRALSGPIADACAGRGAPDCFAVSEFSPAHEFFCSRKLRLAPQDYSPWTPRLDRLSGRSYPPASRHPCALDLVGSALDEHGADGKSPGHARLPRMRASLVLDLEGFRTLLRSAVSS